MTYVYVSTKRGATSHSYRNEIAISIIQMVKSKIIHGNTYRCFRTSIYAMTKMFISSHLYWISFVTLYDSFPWSTILTRWVDMNVMIIWKAIPSVA